MVLTDFNQFPGKFKVEKRIKSLGYNLKKVDLLDSTTLKTLPKNPGLVIHLAAQTDTSKGGFKVNHQGLINLYEALGYLGPKTHIIYLGTMVNTAGRSNYKEPINEDSEYIPTNAYTRAKVLGEYFLIKKCKRDKFSLTILVPNTIYGKYVKSNSLFDVLKKGISSNLLPVRLNWPGKSAFIHIDDVVSAIISFSKITPRPGYPQKYFLYAENLSIPQVCKIMSQKMEVKFKPLNVPDIIWRVLTLGRKYIPKLEPFLSPNIYNQIWRAGIIVDNVVQAKTNKISDVIRGWNPKRLKDSVSDIPL